MRISHPCAAQVALAAEDAGADASPLLDALAALAAAVRDASPSQPAPDAFGSRRARTAWVVALRAAAADARAPRGLRRCDVCGASQAAAHRMDAHLAGKRHCLAVAKRVHDADPAAFEAGPSSADAASDAFQAHSTATLAAATPEPPDVALADLADARHAARLSETGNQEAVRLATPIDTSESVESPS